MEVSGNKGWTILVDNFGGEKSRKIGWKNWVEKLGENIRWTILGEERLVGKEYSVPFTVYSIPYTINRVQCTMYNEVVLLILWREHQCSSVWGVKPFASLLLCLTPLEDSRAVVWGPLNLVKTGSFGPQNKVEFCCQGPQNGV